MDPEAFAPGFSDRLDDFMNTCRQLEPVCTSEQQKKHDNIISFQLTLLEASLQLNSCERKDIY